MSAGEPQQDPGGTELDNTWLMNFHPVKPISSDYCIHDHKLSLVIDEIPKSQQNKARQRATNPGERLNNTANLNI